MSRKRNPKRAPHVQLPSTNGYVIPETQEFITAPDLSITITQVEAVEAMHSVYNLHGREWLELTELQRMLTMAAALSVAMGHDADWTMRMLTNRYFVTCSKVLAQEYGSLFELGMLP